MNRIFIHTSYVLSENDLPTEVDALGLGSRGKQREAEGSRGKQREAEGSRKPRVRSCIATFVQERSRRRRQIQAGSAFTVRAVATGKPDGCSRPGMGSRSWQESAGTTRARPAAPGCRPGCGRGRRRGCGSGTGSDKGTRIRGRRELSTVYSRAVTTDLVDEPWRAGQGLFRPLPGIWHLRTFYNAAGINVSSSTCTMTAEVAGTE